jgi:hypothetical protein
MPSIVGTWKLVSATARDAADTALPSPYGPKAMGRLTFAADGRMMSGRMQWPLGRAGWRQRGVQLLLWQLQL